MPIHSDPAVIEAVARHSARAAVRVHQKMKRGLSSLASIAATAPFVGLFGTLVGIKDSFIIVGDGSTHIGSLAGGISEALPLTALGLLVAILTSWLYTYLSSRMETLDLEMQNASLDLINRLVLLKSTSDPR